MEVQTERNQPNAMARLYDAALKGDVDSLKNLLQEDELIIERCIIQRGCYTQSPLHVAAKMGYLDFVKTILKENSSMCFAHDEDGMTPVHVAAINGKIDVLETFYGENPQAILEHTKSGETVLHLCVKHNKMEALELLLNCKDEVYLELLNSKDSNGNTILHLAVIAKQVEMIKLLLEQKRIEINEVNKKGLTALDCHLLIRKPKKRCWCRRKLIKWDKDDEIGRSLENTKALRAKEALKIQKQEERVKEQSNALMVAASVIAAMAFQVSISPPGGFWQDDLPPVGSPPVPAPSPLTAHTAGTYIQERLQGWDPLVKWNTIALASSLSVILLLIGGLPYSRLFVAILRITMWIAVTAIAATYMIIVQMSQSSRFKATTPIFTVVGSVCLMLILILFHTHNLLVNFVINHPNLRSCFRKYLCCSCVNNKKAQGQP